MKTQFLPLFFPFTYIFLLPAQKHFHETTNAYQPLATDNATQEVDPQDLDAVGHVDDDRLYRKKQSAPLRLMTTEKLALIRSLFVPFMLPLGLVYTAEYMINSVGTHLRSVCGVRVEHEGVKLIFVGRSANFGLSGT